MENFEIRFAEKSRFRKLTYILFRVNIRIEIKVLLIDVSPFIYVVITVQLVGLGRLFFCTMGLQNPQNVIRFYI